MRTLVLAAALPFAASAAAQKLPPAAPLALAAPTVDAAESAPDMAAADPALAAQMDRIEAAVRMPAGAPPLASMTRYYAWADQTEGKVTGVLLAGAAPARKWVDFDSLPATMGRACSVIELVFDVRRGTPDEIYCLGG